MILKQKPLTQRAAEACKNGSSSTDLLAIYREIAVRIDEVDSEQQSKRREIDNTSDLEFLRRTKQELIDLKDEELVLRRLSTDVHQSVKKAKGREAIASAGKFRKELESALQQARKAQEMIADCQRTAVNVITARRDAADIGEPLLFDADVIQGLASAIFHEGNERKQLMIDLGIADSRRARRAVA